MSQDIENIDASYWQQQANCLGVDPDLFFPKDVRRAGPGHKNEDSEETALGRMVCSGCDVRVDCLEYAIDNREKFGMWGGTTADERELIIKRRRQPFPS